MKEIDKLISISSNSLNFQRNYQWCELEVIKDYDSKYITGILESENWPEERRSDVIFFLCAFYFDQKIENLIKAIDNNVVTALNIPSATQHKTQYIHKIASHLIQILHNLHKILRKYEEFNDVKTFDSFKEILPELKLSIVSPIKMVNEMANFTEILFQKDTSSIVDYFKKLNRSNHLFIACNHTIYQIEKCLAVFIKKHPEYINLKDLYRMDKKQSKGEGVILDVRRGRPKSAKETRTLKDIWISKTISYEKTIDFLKTPNTLIDDLIFVFEENEMLSWKKTTSTPAKHIEGYLCVCLENKLIEDGISSRKMQKIFFNTFNLKVSEKSFVSTSIKLTDNKYTKPFLPILN